MSLVIGSRITNFSRPLSAALLAGMALAGLPLASVRADSDGLAHLVNRFAVEWGRSVAEVQGSARPVPQPLLPAFDFGPLLAPLWFEEFALAGSRFAVFFQFDRSGAGLRQILLQRRRGDGQQQAWQRLTGEIEQRLGAAAEDCPAQPRQAVRRAERRWDTPNVTLRAILLDYRAPGLVSEGEPLSDDPTLPRHRREALDIAALPVRLLLRLTPPGAPPDGCR